MTATAPPPGLVLLMVDAQDVFLRALPAAGAKLTRRCAFAAAAAKLLGIPIALTEQVPAKLGATNAGVRAAAGNDAPAFAKSEFSAFAAEGLGEWLRKAGATHILIAGLETPICVYLSVLDAVADDFEVTVLTDATGGRRAEDFPPVWRLMESAGARLLPSETVFYSIVRGAAHPRFREFTALVKQYA
ncbi:MAG TPA: isochorismatase family protein [Opitutales bacterium]|nr:isochorismatase family protein [Opitutales bacterium]